MSGFSALNTHIKVLFFNAVNEINRMNLAS